MAKKEMKNKQEPTIRADDFVELEEGEEPAEFTNFQELSMTVEILKEQLNEITEILRENDIQREKTIKAPYFDYNEVYKRLEE